MYVVVKFTDILCTWYVTITIFTIKSLILDYYSHTQGNFILACTQHSSCTNLIKKYQSIISDIIMEGYFFVYD